MPPPEKRTVKSTWMKKTPKSSISGFWKIVAVSFVIMAKVSGRTIFEMNKPVDLQPLKTTRPKTVT